MKNKLIRLNRGYEKKIRKYFPYFKTIEIRRFITQANRENINIVGTEELVEYFNIIILL